jgi:protein SCO1/2
MLNFSGCSNQQELTAQGSIGQFALTNHRGESFTDDALNETIWIADFIFTSCTTICPELTTKMRWLQAQLSSSKAQPLFISFSVDPDRDTPEVLSNYVKEHKVSDTNWHFVTGDIQSVKTLVVENLKQAMGEDPRDPQNILHGSHFILGKGDMIYGYYTSNKGGLNKLVTATKTLLK